MHYKNGREAKVGDPVLGKLYNQDKNKIFTGVVVGITPGADACNARVAHVIETPIENVWGRQVLIHREDNEVHALELHIEYTQCDWLLHAEDAVLAVDPAALTPKSS